MPIQVPRGPAPQSSEEPSSTDLLMAYATMERLGRLPSFRERLDQSLHGQIDDRRQDEDELAAQEAAAKATRRSVVRPPQDPVMAEFAAMKRRRGEP